MLLKDVIFKKKTVASILSKYHSIVGELREHLDTKLAEADTHKKFIEAAELAHAEAVNEANMAAKTVANFEKLLGL